MLLIDTLQGKITSRVPFWFMRQAGRYLPEYKKTREEAGSFWKLCFTPELAARVTLQPITRFNMDAAILFSDILVIPKGLGREVVFTPGEGPKLTPISKKAEVDSLSVDAVYDTIAPILETIRITRRELDASKALIGFSGSPWTLACYMIEGGGSRDFAKARGLESADPELFSHLIDTLTDAIILYVKAQIEAGVNAIQLFDSWAGIASSAQFDAHIIRPTQKITAALKEAYPNIPIIGFPRMAGIHYERYAKEAGVDAVSMDFQLSASWAKQYLQPHTILQGNLDPMLLVANENLALKEAKRILDILSEKPIVFNLGHGMVPEMPIAHVEALCNFLLSYTR